MLRYELIEEVSLYYPDAPEWIRRWCTEEQKNPDTLISFVKIRDLLVNPCVKTMNVIDIMNYRYRFKDICFSLKPDTPYTLGLCLTLFNSQFLSDVGVMKYMEGRTNEQIPIEYADMVRETNGWIVWDYQFTNIVKLYTDSKEKQIEILRQFKRHNVIEGMIPQEWTIHGDSIIASIQSNLLIPPLVYSHHFRDAWPLYNELVKC